MTKLYQLSLEKLIYEDWSGTIFHSCLYPSKKACIEGCAKEELLSIAHALLQHEDSTMKPDFDPDDLHVLYAQGNEEACQFVADVKKWITRGVKGNFMDSDEREHQSIYGEICQYQVVST